MTLHIVATPIGTLSDLSPHAREVLSSASVIAAEDTRTTRRLLSASDIPAPEIVAVHAHNEDRVAERIAERALTEEVVLACDAGTPGISDPGHLVVTAAHALGVEIRSVPGPSALAASLSASGFPTAPSTFLGFPPRKGRDGWVEATLARSDTLVMYEAPGRIADLAARFAAVAPRREAVLCRELSKKHEEVLRASLPDLATQLAGRELRGECVLVIGPGDAVKTGEPSIGEGSLKEVAAVLAERWGVKRRDAYQRLIAIEEEEE